MAASRDGEGQDAEQGGGKPSPDGEREALPGHAVATQLEDGDEGVDRGHGRGHGEQPDAGEPEVHAEGLAGAGAGDGGEGRVGGPAGDGGAALDEAGAKEGEEGNGGEPEAGGVEAREGHGAGADLRRQDEVAEAGLRGDGHDEEEHEGAVQGDEGEVVLGQDGAVARDSKIGIEQMEAHEQRHDRADDDGDQREGEVLEADDVVVGGEEQGRGKREEGRGSGGLELHCALAGEWSLESEARVEFWKNPGLRGETWGTRRGRGAAVR